MFAIHKRLVQSGARGIHPLRAQLQYSNSFQSATKRQFPPTTFNKLKNSERLFCSGAEQFEKYILYEGPFGPMLRVLKRVSVFSCTCSLIGVPLLTAFGNEKLSSVQRAVVGATVILFAVGTTAMLHTIAKPYVYRIYQMSDKNQLEIQTFNLFGRIRKSVILKDQIMPATGQVWSTFSFQNMFYYVHEESDVYFDDEFYDFLMRKAQVEVNKEKGSSVPDQHQQD